MRLNIFGQKLLTQAEAKALPRIYSQDGKGMDAVALVHFFYGCYDFWATEYNPEDQEFFGLARFTGNDPELGYASAAEWASMGRVERDLHWTPKPLRECVA